MEVIIVDGSDRKTQAWLRTLSTCFLLSFLIFRSAVQRKGIKSEKLTTERALSQSESWAQVHWI